jgi:electron transport complex protein RnfC
MSIRRTFRGGVHPAEHKEATCGLPVQEMPPPARVVLPLRQHLGAPAKAVVQVGDRVAEGQIVGESGGFVSAPVHASIAGEVTAIAKFRHPGGFLADAVVIEARDAAPAPAEGVVPEPWPPHPFALHGANPDYETMAPDLLRSLIRDAGVVGMGGAAFPTFVKLSPPRGKKVDLLVINGAECEPFLTCDHRTMLEETDKVVHGVRILMRALDVARAIVGIEDNKPDAIAVMTQAFAKVPGVTVAACRVKYPQGGEKQLIKALTGREVPPPPGLPLDVGVVVQNVGTAARVADAVMSGRPFVERTITLSGPRIAHPANVRVRLGTMLGEVVAFCGGLTGEPDRVIMGGPMMGVTLSDMEVPIVKGTSGFLFFDAETAADLEAGPCLRCGRCVDICPLRLRPAEIARFIEAGDLDGANALHVRECMECGSCSYVCPSNRWLVQLFRIAKAKLNERKA